MEGFDFTKAEREFNRFGEIPTWDGEPVEYEPMDHLPTDVCEGGECAYCDNRIPVMIEGDYEVAQFEVIEERGDAYLVCFDCWEIAESGADVANISLGKVSTIYAPRAVDCTGGYDSLGRFGHDGDTCPQHEA